MRVEEMENSLPWSGLFPHVPVDGWESSLSNWILGEMFEKQRQWGQAGSTSKRSLEKLLTPIIRESGREDQTLLWGLRPSKGGISPRPPPGTLPPPPANNPSAICLLPSLSP